MVRIVIAGGGTGGHLYPGIAVAEVLRRLAPEAEIHFVGTRRGLEARVLPREGWSCHFLAVRGFPRGTLRGWPGAIPRLGVALAQAGALLRRLRPVVVVGTGGYASGPAVAVALLLRVPTAILEQNMSPGLTTRWLAPLVTEVHLSFAATRQRLRRSARVLVSGNPVREGVLRSERERSCALFGLDPARLTLLVLGGSRGARRLNEILTAALPRLPDDPPWQCIFQTGEEDREWVVNELRPRGLPVSIHPFLDDMGAAYGAADLVLSRAGATTVAELTARGLPAVLVPYPRAAEGHQEENARWMEEAGAALLWPQEKLEADYLARGLTELLQDGDRLACMRKASAGLGKPRAAEAVARSIWELASGRRAE